MRVSRQFKWVVTKLRRPLTADDTELDTLTDPAAARPDQAVGCKPAPWRDLPEELGSSKTAHERLPRRAVDGTWEKLFAAVLAAADADDDIRLDRLSVDSTVCRAYQHAVGARKG